MEHTLRAPADGHLKALRCAVGDFVQEGTELADFEPASGECTSRFRKAMQTQVLNCRMPRAVRMDTQVLIVGAGPTGLTLAVDLGCAACAAPLIEQKEAPQFLPKMERCNARTMEIYRRMGIADRVRAAGLPAHCPMDIFIVLSLVEPPLVHHVHPSVAQAKARIAQMRGCERAARALSVDLAIHARAAVEIDRRGACRASPCVTAASSSISPRMRTSVTAQVKSDGVDLDDHVPPTWSAATAATAWCAGSSASRSTARPTSRSCGRRSIIARISTSASRSARAGTITWPMPQASFLIVQDSTRHFTLHSVVEQRRRHGDDVRAHHRHAGRIRDALCRALADEPAARRPLSARDGSSWPATPCTWSFRPAGSA